MNHLARQALAVDTLAILEAGSYVAPSGATIDIAEKQAGAVNGTKLFRPEDFPADLSVPLKYAETRIEVTAESSLEASRRLAETGESEPLCLNFASARNPGGGFLRGTHAQEESLARSSGLYPCLLTGREMYDYNRNRQNCLYSDYMIYSPGVPVFRDDAGRLLEECYTVAFLTSPAVNAGAVRNNEPERVPFIEATMRERMRKVLWAAAETGHEVLILGAWGCGVFANDPAMVARQFAECLLPGGEFSGAFETTLFAVYDHSEEQRMVNTFRRVLMPR